VKPIVKWAGGKTKLLAELVARMPGEMRTYAEPFSGGAALFFAIADQSEKYARTFDRAILADRNEELVITYNAVKRDVDAVIGELSNYRYDRDLFYETRAKNPHAMSDAERAARLLFLNRTCFNGLWRVNSKGMFNVPFGKYKNPTICDADNLRAASKALARAEIVHADFADVTRDLGARDFVYFDPPYAPISNTADFTAYAAGGFGHEEQVRLMAEVQSLRDRGALVMLSNADTPAMRVLYKDLTLAVVGVSRSINSDATKRGETAELIVTSWGEPGVIEEKISAGASAALHGA
jgi:DNA adenine methylase